MTSFVRYSILAAIAVVALHVPVSAAEPPAEFQKREFAVPNGEALKYVVYVPRDLKPDARIPLLVYLHGSSADCVTHERILIESNLQQWHGYEKNVQKEPTILMAPVGGQAGWTSAVRQQAILGIIDGLMKEFPIDAQRVYLQGFSMGGSGAWFYLQKRPHFFAAANIQGSGGRNIDAEKIKHVPIWATIGSQDQSVEALKTNVAKIRAANGDTRGALTDVMDVNPRFSLFPDTSHGGAQTKTQQMPGFVEWMYSQVNKQPSAAESP